MNVLMGWEAALSANMPYFIALVGLAALDLVVGAARALAAKKFQSGMLRNTLSKFVGEIALPMMLAFLGLANHLFFGFVTAAIWVGIVSEATSLVEQLRGKSSGGLWGQIISLLNDIKAQTQQDNTNQTGGGAA